MKKPILLFLSFLPITLFGQIVSNTAILNNANIILNTNGVMFSDYSNGQPGYEVPAGSGNNSIYAASLRIDQGPLLKIPILKCLLHK